MSTSQQPVEPNKQDVRPRDEGLHNNLQTNSLKARPNTHAAACFFILLFSCLWGGLITFVALPKTIEEVLAIASLGITLGIWCVYFLFSAPIFGPGTPDEPYDRPVVLTLRIFLRNASWLRRKYHPDEDPYQNPANITAPNSHQDKTPAHEPGKTMQTKTALTLPGYGLYVAVIAILLTLVHQQESPDLSTYDQTIRFFVLFFGIGAMTLLIFASDLLDTSSNKYINLVDVTIGDGQKNSKKWTERRIQRHFSGNVSWLGGGGRMGYAGFAAMTIFFVTCTAYIWPIGAGFLAGLFLSILYPTCFGYTENIVTITTTNGERKRQIVIVPEGSTDENNRKTNSDKIGFAMMLIVWAATILLLNYGQHTLLKC